MPNSVFIHISCSISNDSIETTKLNGSKYRYVSLTFIYTQLNVETVLFQTIQFSISIQFSSV